MLGFLKQEAKQREDIMKKRQAEMEARREAKKASRY